jgi:hypothetical protein
MRRPIGAVLLPQLARGRDLSPDQFQSALSVKAGLGTEDI